MIIYADLDCMLDSRLGTLEYIFGDLDKVIDKNNYTDRVTDNFKYISKKVFKQIYKDRTSDVLKSAFNHTPFLDFFNDLVTATQIKNVQSKNRKQPVLYLNIYPYKFKKDELKLLANIIKRSIVNSVELKVISKANLTVDFVKSKFDHMFLYDGIDWINKQIVLDNLTEQNNLKKVTLYTPALIDNKVSKEDENSVFQTLMINLSIIIDLELISVAVMSGKIKK